MEQYDLAAFRRLHAGLAREHDRFLRNLLDLSDAIVDELLRAARSAADRPAGERGEGTFLFAYQLLASKIVSHMESIRALVRIARYGDASMLIRGLIGDVTMIQYLAAYPGDAADWCEMAKIRETKPVKGTRFAELAGKFTEGRLRQEISNAGDRPWSSETYGIYSEPVHPSLWGMKFYSVQETGQLASFAFTYRPVFQRVASFRSVATATALVFDAAECFHVWVQRQSIEWGQGALSRWASVSESLWVQLADAFRWLEQAHVQLYGDPRTAGSMGSRGSSGTP